MNCPIVEKFKTHAHCSHCRHNPDWRAKVKAPEECPEGWTQDRLPPKVGTLIGKIATPIAHALRLPCVDRETKKLKPTSGCAKRKRALDEAAANLLRSK
jgi:hypothetical protein